MSYEYTPCLIDQPMGYAPTRKGNMHPPYVLCIGYTPTLMGYVCTPWAMDASHVLCMYSMGYIPTLTGYACS